MKVTLWGTRGSIACSGPETNYYGGNTSCVEVQGTDGTLLILDAGTGIRRLGLSVDSVKRINILLTHLHLDHIQGLGFFTPLYNPMMEVHIYGPAKSNNHLHTQLARYLSPPLFPVLIGDLPCKLYFHAVPAKDIQIGEFTISATALCHPGFTVGYRVESPSASLAYIPDHEPGLGTTEFPSSPEWTSGYELAHNVDLLIHDAQYTEEEYPSHSGWGHSTVNQAIAFALLTNAKKLITFHHDPAHNDRELDSILEKALHSSKNPNFTVECGREGSVFTLPIATKEK